MVLFLFHLRHPGYLAYALPLKKKKYSHINFEQLAENSEPDVTGPLLTVFLE